MALERRLKEAEMSREGTIGHEEMHCRGLTSRSLSRRKGSATGGEGGDIHGSASMNPAFNYVLNRPCPRVCRAFMPGPRRWTRRRIRDITSRTPIIMRIRKRKKVARPPMRRGLCAPIYAAKMYTSHPPRPI